mgnify:CR=1 FL=1
MALDDTSLVEAGEAAKQNNLSGAIVYGIGNSTEAVYYLDTRWAESLIVSDELRQVINVLLKQSRSYVHHLSDGNQKVPYTILTRQNLFSPGKSKICYLRSVN